MVMIQVPALFLPVGKAKKVSTKVTPKFVEQKKKNKKICALLMRGFDGNEKTSTTKRRSRGTRLS